MTGGPQDGTVVTCDGIEEKVLGSAASSQLRISAGNVAGEHAKLRWDGRDLRLTDAGSSTGTFVNGEKITDARVLSEGDRIYLGPPGSPDSASLLVCPAEPDGGGDIVLDPVELADSAGAPVIMLPPDSPLPLIPAPARSAPNKGSAAPPATSSGTGTTRRPSKPEYTTEMPSIGGDRVREPLNLPPTSSSPMVRKKPAPSGGSPFEALTSLPPMILVGGGAALVLAVVIAAYFILFSGAPPVLHAVNPAKAELGSTVTLTGEKFSSDAAKNTVRFGGQDGNVLSASDTALSVKVPEGAAVGTVEVTVQTSGGRSNSIQFDLFRAPRVTGLVPEVALPGAEVVIRGAQLNSQPPAVVIGGRDAEILQAQPDSIRFRVPADLPMIEGKPVPVRVQIAGESSRPMNLILGHLPLLYEMAPSSGSPGTRVTLKGMGFNPDPAGNVVRFGRKRAVVLSAAASEISAVVPGADQSGSQLPVDVRIESGGSTSTPRSFILMRPSGLFVPRFYPQPVPEHATHDHLLVSTDLGPLLLLTGKGEVASTTLRAMSVTDGLNALVDALVAGRPGAIELREKGVPCVAVVGAPSCLVTPTAEDAAAYDEAWSSVKPATRATPRMLAGHWTALIDDYLTLFVHKQRPYRVLEISPRGKALLEIYGEAVRSTGPAAGVPVSQVSPIPARLETDLKDMALLLPAENQARGAAAIEGLWSGKLEDGQAARNIKIQFRMGKAKPEGTLTTSQGTLNMNVPLTELTYDRTAVRFVALINGHPTTFRGTLKQGVITGTLHPGDAKQPAGQFTLSFVE